MSSRELAYQVETFSDELARLRGTRYRHPSGLCVEVLHKPNFVRQFAAFGVPYGSSMQAYLNEAGEHVEIIPGSAHYLEHCIFDRGEEGGLMATLSALGFESNAFTGYRQTVYFISGVEQKTGDFEQAFFQMLAALQTPTLDENRIELERGIISAELAQYDDQPMSVAYRRLMHNLYTQWGDRNDIGGTQTDIAAITGSQLKAIWQHFYQPSEMKVVLCGDFSNERIEAILKRYLELCQALPKRAFQAIREEETLAVHCAEETLYLEVEVPMFLLGVKRLFKEQISELDLARKQLSLNLLLEALFGEGAKFYQELYEQQLLNESFDIDYSQNADGGVLFVSGELPQGEAKLGELLEAVQILQRPEDWTKQEVDAPFFERLKRKALGHYLHSMDSIYSSGLARIQALLTQKSDLAYPEVVAQSNFALAQAELEFLKHNEAYALIKVLPKGEKNGIHG